MTRLPRKSKALQPDFAEAQKACRTPVEREQLAKVVSTGWTPAELREFSRLYWFRNGRDYPTPTSYRRAINDLAGCEILRITSADEEPSYSHPYVWRKLFRKHGSKPLPPRREGLLQRGRDQSYRISDEEYAWPGHTEEFRSMIEQRARDYFGIASELPLHVNAWAASQRAYWREWEAKEAASRKLREATTLILSPKRPPKGTPRRKLTSQFDHGFWGPKLKPHFNRDFDGHSAAFREEVATRARKDNRLRPNAYVSPRRWKVACQKHYVLVESNEA